MSLESTAFLTSTEHLLAELELIDVLVRLEVRRSRALHKADDQFQGMYISDEEVDQLLQKPLGMPRALWVCGALSSPDAPTLLAAARGECVARKNAALAQGVELRLEELARRFALDEFDIHCVLICLAPELDLRYERLYAYLHDDLTRKRPSIDLTMNLLCASLEERLAARRHFSNTAPLIHWKILQTSEDTQNGRSTLLSQNLKLEERIASWLLGSDGFDSRLASHMRHAQTPPAWYQPAQTWSFPQLQGQPSITYLQGPPGSGGEETAAMLCHQHNRGLLVVEGPEVRKLEGLDSAGGVRLAVREALLTGSALYWNGFDELLADERRPALHLLFKEFQALPSPVFLGGQTPWEPSGPLRDLRYVRVELERPDTSRRREFWAAALAARGIGTISKEEIAHVAEKFRFNEGQMEDATCAALNLAAARNPESPSVEISDLYAACRTQSNQKLSSLARKIRPHYEWRDIILPEDRIEQLREICGHVKHRSLVYDDWGFARKVALGRGLNVLFAGPSGTGKTMAADIMAHELRLDLYKVDLSTVVSKYIGETEKNLSKIFEEAETSNAILFFDEADALFGKRSEVRDAHDRYANIEVGYLLQKMEEHEGLVILATNFRKNMDDAFIRRIHFTVDFPFPGKSDRLRIWKAIWPRDASRTPDLDLEFVASRFELSGGNIRNAAVGAAFLAADDGHRISMDHVIRAIRREYQKMGKVVMEGEFATPDDVP